MGGWFRVRLTLEDILSFDILLNFFEEPKVIGVEFFLVFSLLIIVEKATMIKFNIFYLELF